MLSRLDRYLLREIAFSVVGVTGVLLLILLSNQLAQVLGMAAQYDFPGRVVGKLIWLTTLQQLSVLVPIGLFLGIVLALGRLYHDSEITAMTACGMGPARMFKPIMFFTILVAIGLAVLSYRVVPWASKHGEDLRGEALRAAHFGALEPGRFRSFAGGDAIFYAEKVGKDGSLKGVFAQYRGRDRLEIAVAERAEQRGAGQAEQEFVLFNGRRYEGMPGEPDWRIVEFREHGIPVTLPEAKAGKERIQTRTTRSLIGGQTGKEKAELAWRTAVPVMALVLGLLAVPLSKLRPRQGRFARIGYAVLAYFLYSNIVAAVEVWIEKDAPAGRFGMWWVHLIPIALAVFLIWREEHPGPLRRRSRAEVS